MCIESVSVQTTPLKRSVTVVLYLHRWKCVLRVCVCVNGGSGCGNGGSLELMLLPVMWLFKSIYVVIWLSSVAMDLENG